ncbi:hypothetical protein [Tabrizicola sp.]|uniref:hypothetical protein n=1 Tax=Tabrizicola sp. TaxID=2005166 RepID=UPI003F419615
MRSTNPLFLAPLLALLTTAPALACAPGGSSCRPSEADVLAGLSHTTPWIEFAGVEFSTKPVGGRPEDTFQSFRIYFQAVGIPKADLLEHIYGDELLKACELPVDQPLPVSDGSIYIKRASRGDEVLIFGDLTLGENEVGEWEVGSYLTGYVTKDGVEFFGLPRAGQADLAIIGEASGDAACAMLKK